MTKRILIDALHAEETRVVIADDAQILDYDFVTSAKEQLKGNIYLAKVTRVEPSLQAAFVEYGGGKQGFLPFSEIHPDYYQIPTEDRQKLLEEISAQEDDEDDEDEVKPEGRSRRRRSRRSARARQEDGESVSQPVDAPEENLDDAADMSMDAHAQDNAELPAEQDNTVDNADNGAEFAEEPSSQDSSDHDEVIDENETNMDADSEAQAEANAEAEAKAEGVETLDSEADDMPKKKNFHLRRYKIQEVVRRGQIVLVQVIKEERGNKGASLTTYLSLAGRYCVLMPNSPKDGGISRKIMSPEDRKRLKSITAELKLDSGMSVIIRTAGMDRTRAEIKRDYDNLVKLWNTIRDDTLQSTAPALIYEESSLIKRSLRDLYTNDIDEVIIEGDEGYKAAKNYMKMLLPSHAGKIKEHKDAIPLFYAQNIEDQLLSMHDPVAKLKSGGYIVIDPTEALISIDVNSGRATGERNIEETALKTNIEAAQEVARQLRLRDLAGLIVIDFIDMMDSRNRRAVERALKDALKSDRAKIQLGRISPFGLLEMSRQRMRPSLSETSMVQCPHCTGRGLIRSNESMAIQLIRSIEKEASHKNVSTITVEAAQEVALHLLNTQRDLLRGIEERHGVTVEVTINNNLSPSEVNIDKNKKSSGDRSSRRSRTKRARANDDDKTNVQTAQTVEPNESEELVADTAAEPIESGEKTEENTERRPRRSRGGRNRNRRGRDRNRKDGNASDDANAAADNSGEENASSGTRDHHRRGRDRNWNKDANADNENVQVKNNDNAPHERPIVPAPATPLDVHQPKVQPLPLEAAAAERQAQQDSNKEVRKGWWQKMISLDG